MTRFGMKKTLSLFAISGAIIASSMIPGFAVETYKPAPKNIILMISDGCGYNQIDAASYYQYGATGKQVYEQFPVKVGMSHYSVGFYDPAKAWASFDYVKNGPTDSAAAATAMASGYKTYDAGIGVDINKNPVKLISQRAKELGKSTGVITSVEFSHATPAGFIAHNVSRNNYQAIANEMILSSATDVIMGAGNPWYDDNGVQLSTPKTYQYVGGTATWDGLVNGTLAVADADGDGTPDPWTLIQTKADFEKLTTGATPKRVIGCAQAHTTLQQARGGDGKAAPYVVPMNQNVPSLETMSKGALNVLDNNEKGFFLMIEGGAIDWAGHANQSGRVIEEEIDFNKAVEAVVDWVNTNSNWDDTLLIVTGDHETGYLTGSGSNPTWNPLVNNGAGVLPGMQWNSADHTNSLVPLFAKGAASQLLKNYAKITDPVRGLYLDNTEVAKTMYKTFGYDKQYGDVNNDNKVDVADYLAFRQYLLGMNEAVNVNPAADLNGDGYANAGDYAYLRLYFLDKISTFPADANHDGYANDFLGF